MTRDTARQAIGISALLLAVLFLAPLSWALKGGEEKPAEGPEEEETRLPPFESGALDGDTKLKVLDGERVLELDLGTYLVGVVRAEMPASFELEALKAQAAAARTYTLYKLRAGGNHGDTADICTDSTCCQAYLDEETARANWGAQANENELKIQRAVKETDGQAVLYGGAPILAVFHSSSAGLTRNAGQVWQEDLPYLQAVSSPEAGEAIPNYYSSKEFTKETLKEKLQAAWPDADLTGAVSDWLANPVTDTAGSVTTVSVGGVTVKGAQVRSALGLRSACFEWEEADGKITFYVTGYGHGVGMSQYGANRMAQQGSGYQEILTHYYTGVTVGPCGRDEK